MRLDEVFLVGTGRFLPPALSIERAEESGLVRRSAVWRTGITSVCVSESESGPDMAVRAAESVLATTGCRPADIDLVLHASFYYQGHDLWPAASYVQHHALDNTCPAIEINQMSNGGMAALELATAYLLADETKRYALITTGDRFCAPGIDRWTSDPGTVLADGATAAIVSTRGGFARIRSLVTISDPSLEGMQRGRDPVADAPLATRKPIAVEEQRRSFIARNGLDSVLDRIDSGQREVLKLTLADAGTELDQIDWFVLPNLGRGRLDEYFLRKFDIDPEHTTWSWGSRIGHLGAGDQFAGLGHLADSGLLRPGQRCLLLGAGAGFSWSGAVVEITSIPEGEHGIHA
ncbi:ketoacyl-ACP synthase III family protein [Sciscionella marina]|uniref:ketoacyl-ACP synthase III family protein n=1 Tax=Sciscionella marina TaxID=508770 RepID=UPI00036ED8AD|nr:ketoacyl-ACP synthase III family protein [Sciscionella marina]